MKYSIVVSLLTYISLLDHIYTFGRKIVDSELDTPRHVIVIDAGSTASRVDVLMFHNSILDGQLMIDNKLFYETKPGLSSYAKHPEDVENSLDILLDKAKLRIPPSERATTPLILRATAGLRLLPYNETQNILEECKRIFATSGFKVTDDSVTIMDGSDEGMFSWFTLNFLLGKFSGSGKTVAALDLGGGSTQVTFSVTPGAFLKNEKNIRHMSVFNRIFSVFTESFLGMGLMAARKAILTHPDNQNDPATTKGSADVELAAECVSPSVAGFKWNYAGKNYIVKGPQTVGAAERKSVIFSKCLDIIKKVVDSAIPHGLPSLREHEIYAFSFYYDRAVEAGLIDPVAGGIVTVESIYKAAFYVCENPNVNEPFMCLDLSYIYVLLHGGFGIDKSSNIYMRKYINGHQVSWTVGAAFNVLQNEAKSYFDNSSHVL